MLQVQYRAWFWIISSFLMLTCGLFGSFKNLYENGFFRVVLPILMLLTALQWMLTRLQLRWRLACAGGSLMVGLIFLFSGKSLIPSNFANFSTVFLFGMLAHGMILCFLAAGGVEKGIIMAQHVAISFVVLIGLGLNLNGVAPKLSAGPTATAAFLFWSPLAAAGLWTGAAVINKHEKGSLMLVVALVQVGIGLWDLESTWNLKWGSRLRSWRGFWLWLSLDTWRRGGTYKDWNEVRQKALRVFVAFEEW